MNQIISSSLQQYANTLLQSHLVKANLYFKKNYNVPTITYQKKGSVAGSAFLIRWEIQLNSLMLIEHQKTFIEEVIPHELAHLIAFKEFGNKIAPHGKEWKWIMSYIFSCQPKRTHNFSLPQITTAKQFLYSCHCQTHLLSVIRHKRIEQKQTKYFCKKCHTPLVADKKGSTSQ